MYRIRSQSSNIDVVFYFFNFDFPFFYQKIGDTIFFIKLQKLESKIEKQKVKEGGGKKAATKTKKTTGAKVGKENV